MSDYIPTSSMTVNSTSCWITDYTVYPSLIDSMKMYGGTSTINFSGNTATMNISGARNQDIRHSVSKLIGKDYPTTFNLDDVIFDLIEQVQHLKDIREKEEIQKRESLDTNDPFMHFFLMRGTVAAPLYWTGESEHTRIWSCDINDAIPFGSFYAAREFASEMVLRHEDATFRDAFVIGREKVREKEDVSDNDHPKEQ